MEIYNKVLIDVISRIRNRITVNQNTICFNNIHSANNEITIKGERSSISFGEESYTRSGKMLIRGNDNSFMVDEKSVLSDSSIKVVGNSNIIRIGSNCKVSNISIYILGDNNHITIEEGVSSVYTSLHIEENQNIIIIGEGTTLHGRDNNRIELALDEGTTIRIGKDCMISNDVNFRSSDSHSVLNKKEERINPAGSIVINDHVWIGMKSLILKNTTIQNNCVIGAGSICNKDYEKENCLIAGNPARVVREDINWSRDRL